MIAKTNAQNAPLSQVIRGTITWNWKFVVTSLVMIGLFLLGCYAYWLQVDRGLVVTGLRNVGHGGATWGIYIAFYVYFVGISFSGIAVAALVRLFGIEELKPLSRMAELLTIIALCLGGMTIIADSERPAVILRNFALYARTSSPFFGTFTLIVGGYLFSSLVYFYLALRSDVGWCRDHTPRFRWLYALVAAGHRNTALEREHHRWTSFWLAILILPLLVAAHSTLGFVFGIQGGRPGWFSALQAPGFVVMACVSGIGMLIVLAAWVRWYFHYEDKIKPRAFALLSNMLWVSIVIYLYFMGVEELTANYASSHMAAEVAHQVVFGAYAGSFWLVVTCLVVPLAILFRQFVTGQVSISQAVFAGLLVQVAGVLKRHLIVVPSQTHGALLAYHTGVYNPTWVEFAVVIGLTALGVLMFLAFMTFFPLVPLPPREVAEESTVDRRKTLRRIAFWAVAVLGCATAVAGFAASARMGTKPYLDPVIPASPVVFIVGVMVAFCSFVAYEVLPNSQPKVATDTPATTATDASSQ